MFKKIIKTTVRTKLIIAVSALIAVISVFIFIYCPRKLEKHLLDSMTVKADQISRMIAYGATPALYFDDQDAVEDIFGAARLNEDLEYILITRSDSTVFAEFRRNPDVDYLPDEKSTKQARRRFFSIIQKMEYDNQTLGFLRIAFSMQPLQEELGMARFRIFLVSLGVFMFGVLVISMISRIISTPLKRMVETVEKIAAGDLTDRVNVYSNDEIGFLAREFDVMLDRLVNAYKNLDELNQELEIRIESRTAALRLSNAQLKSELKERKQIERELSAERVRLMATLSKIEEGVITTDADNNISVMNRVAAEITGWNEIDAIGKPIMDVFKLPVSADNGANVQDIHDFIRQLKEEENSSHITIVDSESQEKQLAINVIPIHTLYGERSGTVFIFQISSEKPAPNSVDLKKFQA